MMAAGDSDSEFSKVENLVSKFFSKCLHVILESRYTYAVLQNKGTSKVTTIKDKWFNLILKDIVPPELIRINYVSSSVELVVDLVLLHRSRHSNSTVVLPPLNGSSPHWDGKEGKVIERWVMMFEGNKGRDDSDTNSLKDSSSSMSFYKKCGLMLRSLCLMVKLLPAYKLFRYLTASSKPSEFSICHHISPFTESFTREEEAQMQKFVFDPVESSGGSLCLSVIYLSSPGDLVTEPPSYQMLQHIVIPNYIGDISVAPVCKAPKFHDNIMVTYGLKLPGIGGKPPLSTKIGVTTQGQHSAGLITNAAARETSGEEPKTAVSVRRQTYPSRKRSHSLDCFRSQVHHYLNLKELRDPFQPRPSDNAVLGCMCSIFNAAAPLRQTSAFTPNNPDLQANQKVKTTSDALRELQELIDLKNRILQRTPAGTKSSIGQDSTPVSK